MQHVGSRRVAVLAIQQLDGQIFRFEQASVLVLHPRQRPQLDADHFRQMRRGQRLGEAQGQALHRVQALGAVFRQGA